MKTNKNTELERYIRLGVTQVTKYTTQIRSKALAAYRDGNMHVDLIGDFIEKAHPILTQAMLVGHLQGYKQVFDAVPKTLKRSVIRLDFNEIQEVLERQLHTDSKALNELYSTRAFTILNGASDAIEGELRKEIGALISEGATVRTGIDTLRTKFDNLGLSPVKDHVLETIFRTNLQLSNQAGQYLGYKDPAIDEILWGFRYDAVNDDRTREAHQILHNTVLPKSDPFWTRFWPPNGWNCRCNVIPLFEPEKSKRPTEEVEPDAGFNFNPGQVYEVEPPQLPPTPITAPRKALPKKTAPTPESIEKKPLTPAQIDAVKSPAQAELSRRLRAEQPVDDLKKIQEHTDNALKRSPAVKRMIGYREITQPYFELGVADIDRLKPGDVFADRGYMVLNATKSTTAQIIIRVVTERGEAILTPDNSTQVLPRGARFKVKSKRINGGKLEISVVRI